MKARIASVVAASCLLAVAAWLVHKQTAVSHEPTSGDVPKSDDTNKVPEKYAETVHKGLDYLVKNQHKDGHWEGDDGKHPVAMTGLVGLALLMERDGAQYVNGKRARKEPKYLANMRKAADWLLEKCDGKSDGLIYSEHPSETARYMEGHGLATLFLAGVWKDEEDDARRKKLTDVVTKAVKYIVKAQSTQGGWYHTSKVEGHDFDTISATVIQIQALQAAENIGTPVPREAMNDAKEYLKKAIAKYERTAKSEQNPNRMVDAASALSSLFNDETRQMDELGEKWYKYCRTEIPIGSAMKFGRHELIHYYYAQAVFSLRGKDWSEYRAVMFDHLKTAQNKDGSWPASEGISVGQVYSTAVWCAILQLDKLSHPSTRPVYVTK